MEMADRGREALGPEQCGWHLHSEDSVPALVCHNELAPSPAGEVAIPIRQTDDVLNRLSDLLDSGFPVGKLVPIEILDQGLTVFDVEMVTHGQPRGDGAFNQQSWQLLRHS